MRLAIRLLIFTGLLAGINTAYAQEVTTSTETSSSAKVSLKSGKMPKANKFKTWDVALHGGLLIPNTDLATTDFNAPNLIAQIGYGLSVTKFLSHSFAILACPL